MQTADHMVFRMHSIGLICASWSYLEHLVAVCFWSLIDMEEEYAKILTDNIDLQKRFELLLQFADRKLPPDDIAILKAIYIQLGTVTAERNLAVHGRWVIEGGSPANITATMTRGKFKHIPQEMTQERMDKAWADIDDIAENLARVFEGRGLLTLTE